MTPVCAAKNLIAEEKHWLLVKLANLNSTLAIGEKGGFCYINCTMYTNIFNPSPEADSIF